MERELSAIGFRSLEAICTAQNQQSAPLRLTSYIVDLPFVCLDLVSDVDLVHALRPEDAEIRRNCQRWRHKRNDRTQTLPSSVEKNLGV